MGMFGVIYFYSVVDVYFLYVCVYVFCLYNKYGYLYYLYYLYINIMYNIVMQKLVILVCMGNKICMFFVLKRLSRVFFVGQMIFLFGDFMFKVYFLYYLYIGYV